MFGVDVGDPAQIGLNEVMLDAAVDVQAQVFGRAAVGQIRHELARDRVQPARALVAADGKHESVGSIDDGGCADGTALFAERIAVVPGDAGIDAVVGRGHCAGESEKRTRGDRHRIGHHSIVGAPGHSL